MGGHILRNNHTLADTIRWTPEERTQRNIPNSEDLNSIATEVYKLLATQLFTYSEPGSKNRAQLTAR